MHPTGTPLSDLYQALENEKQAYDNIDGEIQQNGPYLVGDVDNVATQYEGLGQACDQASSDIGSGNDAAVDTDIENIAQAVDGITAAIEGVSVSTDGQSSDTSGVPIDQALQHNIVGLNTMSASFANLDQVLESSNDAAITTLAQDAVENHVDQGLADMAGARQGMADTFASLDPNISNALSEAATAESNLGSTVTQKANGQ